MEVSLVRKRVQSTITAARADAQGRRQRVADAERAYATFLQDVAAPLFHQIAGVLKAEGYAFTVFTPADTVRLSLDRGRDDFVELALDTESPSPQVIARISRTRGSRRLDEERPLKPGAPPDALAEEDVLDLVLPALEPWLER